MSDKPGNDQKVDEQTRKLAQEAGLDGEMEAMVPPRWGPSTFRLLGLIALLIVIAIISIMTVFS